MNAYLVNERPLRRRVAARVPACAITCAIAALLVAAPVAAQLVTPRTVPVFQDEQFEIYPSSRPGLAGVSIALDDTLGDSFSNPAKATRLRGLTLTTAPYSHGISGNRGGGRTLPIGFLASNGVWAGAFLGAIQQLDRVGPTWNRPTSEQKATNQYLTAAIARKFAEGLSIGVSGFNAELGAIDGVDLLYAGSDRIEQNGSVTDVRLGVNKEWATGHNLDMILVHNRTNMRHDVRFTDMLFNPQLRVWTRREREESNLDQTNIWGAHTEYTRPVGNEGWRVGVLGTANVLDHPKIPNYVLQNIPRDPGTTYAFNVGLGAARVAGPLTLGVDVVLEPMRSSTWADQTADVTRLDGSVLRAGERTIENEFTFRNSKARLGIGRAWTTDSASQSTLSFDFGLSVYSISYDLRQTNNITRMTRRQHENWVESGPSFGLRFRSNDIEMSYAFRAICGSSGGCSPVSRGGFTGMDRVSAPAAGGIIAAPSSPLFFQQGRQTSHHFTVAVPMR